MGSTRLPGKVLMDLSGKTVLERVIERVSLSKYIDEVIVATTFLPIDLPIVQLCSGKNIRVYCGSEDDVLDRYYQPARLIKPDSIVRITADCPLIDAAIIDKVCELHYKNENDYTANTNPPTFPDGLDTEIFTYQSLKIAWEKAELLSEREHVTPFIKKNNSIFKIGNYLNSEDYSAKRWTLDNIEDYQFINKIFEKNHIYCIDGMEDILALLEQYPELEKINQGIKRDEGYAKSLRNDKKI